MKGMLKLVLLLAVVAVIGKYAYDFYHKQANEEKARARVDSVLHAINQADDQTALCEWAKGVPVLPMEEMNTYANDFDKWRREHFLVDVRAYAILEVVPESGAVAVNAKVNDRDYVFVVKEGEPISIRE